MSSLHISSPSLRSYCHFWITGMAAACTDCIASSPLILLFRKMLFLVFLKKMKLRQVLAPPTENQNKSADFRAKLTSSANQQQTKQQKSPVKFLKIWSSFDLFRFTAAVLTESTNAPNVKKDSKNIGLWNSTWKFTTLNTRSNAASAKKYFGPSGNWSSIKWTTEGRDPILVRSAPSLARPNSSSMSIGASIR